MALQLDVYLGGTISCDFGPQAITLSESIVHELGRDFFNSVLEVERQTVPSKPRFYSPWRHELRSAFGMAHANFTFSVLTLFHAEIDALCPARQVREYAEARRRVELEHLRYARPTLEQLLNEVASASLRRLLTTQFEAAIENG